MNEEQLAHLQACVDQLHAGHRELVGHLAALRSPATLKVHRLTSTNPVRYDKASTEAETLSIGILNPTAITVYLGLGGGTASAAAEAVPVAPKSLLVLPVAVAQLEVGAAPADVAAADAIVFLLRFDTVQPASLGSVFN